MERSEPIKEANHGSAAAQRYLFDQFSEKMLMICRRYVKSSEDSEELMLNGFFRLGAGKLKLLKTTIEPSMYFNNFF